jgi:hypothetical protein
MIKSIFIPALRAFIEVLDTLVSNLSMPLMNLNTKHQAKV